MDFRFNLESVCSSPFFVQNGYQISAQLLRLRSWLPLLLATHLLLQRCILRQRYNGDDES